MNRTTYDILLKYGARLGKVKPPNSRSPFPHLFVELEPLGRLARAYYIDAYELMKEDGILLREIKAQSTIGEADWNDEEKSYDWVGNLDLSPYPLTVKVFNYRASIEDTSDYDRWGSFVIDVDFAVVYDQGLPVDVYQLDDFITEYIKKMQVAHDAKQSGGVLDSPGDADILEI